MNYCVYNEAASGLQRLVLSAKVKKAAEQEEEEGEKEVIQEPVERPSGTEQPTVYNEVKAKDVNAVASKNTYL